MTDSKNIMDSIPESMAQEIVDRIKTQGHCTVKTADGHVFFFSKKIIDQLVEQVESNQLGAAAVFVPNQVYQ